MHVRNTAEQWQIYRTRFLIKAQQLREPLVFVDALGREHRGGEGDYLVESSDGTRRIAPREIFEDIYVPMGPADDNPPSSPGVTHLCPPCGAGYPLRPEFRAAPETLITSCGKRRRSAPASLPLRVRYNI